MEPTQQEKKDLLAQQLRARDLTDAFLDCRSLRHAWREVKPDRVVPYGEPHTFQCLRCLSLRDDVISPRFGELLTRSYRHAPGYIQKAPEDGSRTFSIAALRSERSRRLKEGKLTLAEITPLPEAA